MAKSIEGEHLRVGRKTKYRKEMLSIAAQAYSEGDLDIQVMVKLGISHQTFYRWCKENKEFSDTVDMGKSVSQNVWIERMKGLFLCDKNPNFNAMKFVMCNSFGWKSDNAALIVEESKVQDLEPLIQANSVSQYNKMMKGLLEVDK